MRYNIMLDGLPTEYEGYLIRTDFRIGMQISEVLNDVNLAEPEKMYKAYELLYGSGVPSDRETAIGGLQWFMRGGEEENDNSHSDGKPPVFDFEQDNRLVYSAFRARFGIDLTRERLHWFAFLAMLSDLGGCSLSEVMSIRSTDLSKLSGEQQKHYAELKERYKIQQPLSDAEQAMIAEFEEQLG
ncbi:MAG: hypothetical protein IJZ95_07270 [Oscillospiraceae bacterium]|nr:hypothetical protein [Oscillospiraceae bacterium]